MGGISSSSSSNTDPDYIPERVLEALDNADMLATQLMSEEAGSGCGRTPKKALKIEDYSNIQQLVASIVGRIVEPIMGNYQNLLPEPQPHEYTNNQKYV